MYWQELNCSKEEAQAIVVRIRVREWCTSSESDVFRSTPRAFVGCTRQITTVQQAAVVDSCSMGRAHSDRFRKMTRWDDLLGCRWSLYVETGVRHPNDHSTFSFCLGMELRTSRCQRQTRLTSRMRSEGSRERQDPITLVLTI